MSSLSRTRRSLLPGAGCLGLLLWTAAAGLHAAPAVTVRIEQIQGQAEIMVPGNPRWILTQTNQVLQPLDRLRTKANARVTLRWSDQSVITFGELTEIEILPPHSPGALAGLHLGRGIFSFLHRERPGRIRVITRGAVAGVEGTEFVMEVAGADNAERTTLSLLDGRVRFSNALDELVLTNGQQAVAGIGLAPTLTRGFTVQNVLQWCFYYPAVLNPADLPLSKEEQQILHESLAAYASGDLPAALAGYPAGRQPASGAESVYLAALYLSVGQAAKAETLLEALPAGKPVGRPQQIGGALRQLIAVVRRQPNPSALAPQLPTELLAASYFEQSRALKDESLRAALELAKQAATAAPEFSFAWARVAELEFSFGRTRAALDAVDKSLALAPRNAQALAMKGFLLAGQNNTREAIDWFNRAIAVDSALGNAWLGRGLCRIRRGDTSGGRGDLLVAAALEPQRAFLRSYLGKAYGDAGDPMRARHELDRAKHLDPADPTAWLYSALLNEQYNRFNEGIRDLERSRELNENRQLYRSKMLLDQDRAVRSANLARLYDEVGLSDVAIREAGQAVADHYTSYSAHLFLANAYQEARTASPFGQRFETPAFSEYLVATLLGPADGRLLAQPVSQQEYTRLFEQDGFGVSSTTEYLSRGAWNQYGAQYGTFGKSSYALEARYQFDPGQAANAELETRTLSVKTKQMITPQDSLMLQVFENRWNGGDVAQRHEPSATLRGLRFEERQPLNILLGYHREWSPESHSLLLVSRIDDRFQVAHPNAFAWLLATDAGDPDLAIPTDLTRSFRSRFTTTALELQQLQNAGPQSLIFGVRYQSNSERISNTDSALPGNLSDGAWSAYFSSIPFSFPHEHVSLRTERASAYAYDYFQVHQDWRLFGGLTADYLTLPRNTIAPPIDDSRENVSRVSPHAGLLWEPTPDAVVKVGYSQSLGGHDLDQSIRLEPAHFAGLPTVFRTAFPDSLVGGISGERMDILQADGRLRMGRQTYAVLSLQQLESKAHRQVGAYTGELGGDPVPTAADEKLKLREHKLLISLRRLVGDYASFGAAYEVARASLEQHLTGIDARFCDDGDCTAQRRGTLHALSLDGIGNHPSGFFASVNATWRLQTSLNDSESGGRISGDGFWQMGVYLGYRSPRRHVECLAGLLNVTGKNYRLHPINTYLDLPRERTIALRVRINF